MPVSHRTWLLSGAAALAGSARTATVPWHAGHGRLYERQNTPGRIVG